MFKPPSLIFALLAGLTFAACADDRGDLKGVPFGEGGAPMRPGGQGGAGGSDFTDAGSGDAADDTSALVCPAVPTAYVLETIDPYTNAPSSAGALLVSAGFDVQPLPLDRDPSTLVGLIVFGSFASEEPAYRDYVARYAAGLTRFVELGNVLLQLPQADQTEPMPPFVPAGRLARRVDDDLPRLFLNDAAHPLVKGFPTRPDGFLTWEAPTVGWETFIFQGGFQILAANAPTSERIALMEGGLGRGRLILSAMPLDKPVGAEPLRLGVAGPFFRNLFGFVTAVCQRQAPAAQPTPSGAFPGFSDRSTMLALLPDTQIYSINWPGIYVAQTSWIAANASKRRIPYVLHLGDITDQNTALEWTRAAQAMAALDGVVPYALVGGNHDYGPYGSASTRDTLLNDYFPFERAEAMPSFGGAFEPGKLDNTYHYVSVGGRDYIIIALEWGPRDAIVAWADQVMEAHPDRYGILITHAYLYSDSRRYDFARDKSQAWNPHFYHTAGDVNDGEELWQKLVRKHAFVFVFNGHVLNDGTGYLASVTDRGTTCHQMLSNYQFRELGGEGYMRLLEFLEDGASVRVYTYSPLHDRFLTEPDQSFSFKLDLPPGPRP